MGSLQPMTDRLATHTSNTTVKISVVTCISCARRPAALSIRYANRLNPESNRGIRTVPLPSGDRSRRTRSRLMTDLHYQPQAHSLTHSVSGPRDVAVRSQTDVSCCPFYPPQYRLVDFRVTGHAVLSSTEQVCVCSASPTRLSTWHCPRLLLSAVLRRRCC